MSESRDWGAFMAFFFLLPFFRGLGAGYTNERMKQGGRGGEDIRGMWSLFHVYSSLHPRHRMRLYAYKDIPSFLVFEHKIAYMQYLQKNAKLHHFNFTHKPPPYAQYHPFLSL